MSPKAFAGVVLAGGRSRRMGTDKAGLRLPDGRTLLQRQADLLRRVGAGPCLVSIRRGQQLSPWPDGATAVEDAGDFGPLGGIVAALRACPHDRLLVLAVDLPRLEPDTLQQLARASDGRGAVARSGGRLEPLAAFYPRAWLPVAEAALATRQLSLQTLLAAPEAAGFFRFVDVPATEAFFNWNYPEEFTP